MPILHHCTTVLCLGVEYKYTSGTVFSLGLLILLSTVVVNENIVKLGLILL